MARKSHISLLLALLLPPLLLAPPAVSQQLARLKVTPEKTASKAMATNVSYKKLSSPLSAYELYQIYRDKTWTWGSGGVHFFDEGRRMIAYSDNNGEQSFAEGTWSLDNKGRLCMRAVWTNVEGAAKAVTCFRHAKLGEKIVQRKEPGGKWYVFRHAEPTPDDESAKLVPEDTVSAKALELKTVLTAQN